MEDASAKRFENGEMNSVSATHLFKNGSEAIEVDS
jgi:hypothetical protein